MQRRSEENDRVEPVQVFIAGDSTAASYPNDREPLSGWGEWLGGYFHASIEVRNEAVSGASSKSFRSEGYLERIDKQLRPGDYLFVQFGHYDQKPDERRATDPATTFPEELTRYVELALGRGAVPVLLTPVERRKVTDTGELAETHGAYPDAIRRLAAERGVVLLDLGRASLALYRSLGAEPSKSLFVWTKPGEYAAYPDGVQDNTHFRTEGAQRIAGLVAGMIRDSRLGMRDDLL